MGLPLCYAGAREVSPSPPDTSPRWAFPHHYEQAGPSWEYHRLWVLPLRTHLMKRQSIPVHQGNACKGSEVLTRDIYFCWRNSLKRLTKPKTYTTFTGFEVLTHKGKEMRQQTPSAVTSSVWTSPEGSQTCQQPSRPTPSARWEL